MSKQGDALGRHVLADLHDAPSEVLGDPVAIENALLRAAHAAGATPLFSRFHHFGPGQGVTGVLLLQESHISIHTWPEHGFAALDAFMCGGCRPRDAVEIVVSALGARRVELREERRGEGVLDLLRHF
ncbi:adenosylmethionine decarboxylase [Noviherbaspirillum galbum]|uniref:S-adenosylmethionine decarboxylase proenzyme n=1 Tax=Noviherbaspirillum galbum TaxID=2709383 RepID=A0A6B3SM22_9BURK|nr:adenosylmethionine decarboxylase [Noviherbaspirillum galbum]NEX61871.1 adenosylmethionine decarboxylase [Noviherbaspirillum galbum]